MTVRIAIDLALDRLFTYAVPVALEGEIKVGQLVDVPFGHRSARGFVLAVETGEPDGTDGGSGAPELLPKEFSLKPGFKLKAISEVADPVPFFTPALLELVKRLAAYTAAPLESVLKAALPAAVLKKNMRARELLYVEPALTPFENVTLTAKQQWLYEQIVRLGGGWLRQLVNELKTTPATLKVLAEKGVVQIKPHVRRRDPFAGRRYLPTKPLPLNPEQSVALAAILAPDPQPSTVLLHGVTGSGKTEVYLQAIARELDAGKGAIVMVPEISLTPQTVQRFASRFGDRVAVLHSALSDGERYDEWHRIRSGRAQVVVGPRSAVFAPVRNLGLIVVDEEHETSYKQEDNPRYHARDAAVLRGAIEGAKVVLGSATPSLESWANAKRGKYALATMTKRAGAGTLPVVHLVDMTEGGGSGGIFSKDLLDAIRLRLDRHEQTILFLNRRGYSRSMTCGACGWTATCPACDVPYTYHRADDCLRCHICGGWILPPKECPGCRSAALTYVGTGTQRAEAALRKCFPKAAVLRMDADATSRKNSHDDILGAFRRQEADILIGTQMIAKGLDFPNVTLVGVLNADSSLNMPDFRAGERTYQLLAQVAGRAGRAELPGEVFVQAYDPQNPVLRAVAGCGGYADFAERELAARREGDFPPFCHLALVRLRSQDLELVAAWADMYSKSLAKCAGLRVSEALPSALEKADGWYRWQIVVRAAAATAIVKAWRWVLKVRPPVAALRVALDVDAYDVA